MAEPAEKPPFDPTQLLGKLESIVSDNKAKAPASGGKSWVSTLIIVAVVLVGIAVWSWISFRNGRELAKLRHEKETARILAEKAVVDAKLEVNEAVKREAKAKQVQAEERLKLIEADVRAAEEKHAADLRAINSIRSWRDVDPSAGG